jgi:hypothetical protein
MRTPWIVAGLLVAGCGSAPHEPAPDAQIRDVVLRSYTSSDARDCGRLFTTAFLRDIYRGRAGCEHNMRTRRPRNIRVLAISRQGRVADARIRMKGVDATVKVVLAGRQWRVDDVIGHDGSVRQNIVQGPQDLKTTRVEAPRPLGAVVAFRSPPHIEPEASFTVQVLDVIADGRTRTGMRSGYGPVYTESGGVATQVKLRVVNVQVRLTASGPKPFTGTLSASLEGTNGGSSPELSHTGRLPDWSDGEDKGIEPGHSATRWLTFEIPFAALPTVVELQPVTPAIVEPGTGRWLASSGR